MISNSVRIFVVFCIGVFLSGCDSASTGTELPPLTPGDASFKGHVLGKATIHDFKQAFPDCDITNWGGGDHGVDITTTYAGHPCTVRANFVDGVLYIVTIQLKSVAEGDVMRTLENEYGKPSQFGFAKCVYRFADGWISVTSNDKHTTIRIMHDPESGDVKISPPSTDLWVEQP